MPFDAAVFDFDGTLVDSATVKRDAFFAIFPDTEQHRAIVARVLTDDPDGSRHRVIPRMIELMRAGPLAIGPSPNALIERYGEVSEAAVRRAAELPGASVILAALAPSMQLHVCSNTPRETVRAHVAARGWSGHFCTVEGHPTVKVAKVASVMRNGEDVAFRTHDQAATRVGELGLGAATVHPGDVGLILNRARLQQGDPMMNPLNRPVGNDRNAPK